MAGLLALLAGWLPLLACLLVRGLCAGWLARSPCPVLSLIRHLQPDQILTRQDVVPIILQLITEALKEDVRVADLAAAREDVRHEDTVWVGGARPVLDARLRVAAQVLPVGRPAVAEGLGDAPAALGAEVGLHEDGIVKGEVGVCVA